MGTSALGGNTPQNADMGKAPFSPVVRTHRVCPGGGLLGVVGSEVVTVNSLEKSGVWPSHI